MIDAGRPGAADTGGNRRLWLWGGVGGLVVVGLVGLLVAGRGRGPAPGAGGAVFAGLTTPVAMNGGAQGAFMATLAGAGVGVGNDNGIWRADSAGKVSLIVREGASVQIASGVVRTIATLNMIYALEGGEDGRFVSLASAGQIVYHASFVGGGQGIMVDPYSGALLAGADPRRDGYALAI